VFDRAEFGKLRQRRCYIGSLGQQADFALLFAIQVVVAGDSRSPQQGAEHQCC
jgi:hypothetical protein